ncbi:hypothetical protein UMZ34_23670 [Halopseudomonas pachastrellae]|nr:hypothetical protein UMZ34_23670 [Halopseudomonas pachastrellae]
MAELRASVGEEFDTADILQRLTALESKPAPVPVQIVNASRALVLADASHYLAVDSAAAVTLTLPAQATVEWPANTEIYIQQIGDGQVTIDASAVTIITEETLTTRKRARPSPSSGWARICGRCLVRWRQRNDQRHYCGVSTATGTCYRTARDHRGSVRGWVLRRRSNPGGWPRRRGVRHHFCPANTRCQLAIQDQRNGYPRRR